MTNLMNDSRPDATTDDRDTATGRRTRRAGWLAAAAAAGVLLVTPAMAQMGAWGGGTSDAPAGTFDRAQLHAPWAGGGPGGFGPMGGGYGMTQRGYGGGPGTYGPHHGGHHGGMYGPQSFGPADGAFGAGRGAPMAPGFQGASAMLPGMLQRLPIGTSVSVAAYADDPATGAQATEVLTAVVGETSEIAFAQDVQEAASDAAFLTIETGERSRRIDLSTDGAQAPLGFLGRVGGPLEIGQTVTVSFFASADDATPSTTLSFTAGEDSQIAFHQALAEAAAESDVAQVVLPAQSRTIDLSSLPFSGGAQDGFGPGRGFAPRR